MNVFYVLTFTHHIHHSHFEIRMMSVSQSMVLAAPGNDEYQLSMRLCLAGQRKSGRVDPLHSMTLWLFFTHSNHVFLGFPRPLVPGILKSVTEQMQDAAGCTCPHHLGRRLRRTPVISSMPNFLSSETEGETPSVSLLKKFGISLWCHGSHNGHCRSETLQFRDVRGIVSLLRKWAHFWQSN